MIDHCNSLPTVQLGVGVFAIEVRWLEQYLEKAAEAAGYVQWWPAEHVAQTISVFLGAQSESGPLSFQLFTATVQGVLEGIGYGEVAPHFMRSGLELGVSLLELSERASPGFELGFFKECERSVECLLATPVVGRVYFQDLTPAVKRVLRKAHWCRECDRLRDELVSFLRARLERGCGARNLGFSIS